MSAVRPEFGPTLRELLGPRVRRIPLVLRAGVVVLALALAAAGGVAALRDDLRHEVIRGPLTFNLVHPEALIRVAPRPGELLRLQSRPGARYRFSYVVRPITLPSYRGDVSGFLPFYGERLIAAMRRSTPAFVLRGEGRVRINDVPGYGLLFQTRRGGRLVYGRRVLLFPVESGVRRGLDLLLLADASPVVPYVDAVGSAGPLKPAMRSLRFGTDRS